VPVPHSTERRTAESSPNALHKIIAVFEAFLVEGEELRLSDLCRLTGLNKSTCYFIAQALVQQGYLTQAGKRGTYFLGLRFIELANVVRSKLNVADVALPFMTLLKDQLNETVELAVRDGAYCAVVAQVRADRLLAASGTGKWAARIPLHNTACGKVLAANVDADTWQALRPELILRRETPRTLTTLSALEEQLESIRRDGFAIDDEEAETGIRSLSAPIRGSSGDVIAAVLIIGPKSRLGRAQMEECKTLVTECANHISAAMGFSASNRTKRASGRC
jgi:DNA-binding IclR family transcriptional regulator